MKKTIPIIIAIIIIISLAIGAFFIGKTMSIQTVAPRINPDAIQSENNTVSSNVTSTKPMQQDTINNNTILKQKATTNNAPVNNPVHKSISNKINEPVNNIVKNNPQNQNLNTQKNIQNNSDFHQDGFYGIKAVNHSINQMLHPRTVMVENTTGKPISNALLVSVIKKWILQDQYNYSGFADCNGTMWSKHWLDNIPDSDLVNYFIEANGEIALRTAISASELNKTAEKSLQFAEDHPMPFSQKQAKIYITQMLKQSQGVAPTKIVFHGNEKTGGLYYVYTKNSGNNPDWYVESWIGYGTGA